MQLQYNIVPLKDDLSYTMWEILKVFPKIHRKKLVYPVDDAVILLAEGIKFHIDKYGVDVIHLVLPYEFYLELAISLEKDNSAPYPRKGDSNDDVITFMGISVDVYENGTRSIAYIGSVKPPMKLVTESVDEEEEEDVSEREEGE